MKTNVRKEGNAVIVSIGGRLTYENTDTFKESLIKLQEDSKKDQVVFDLTELEFVGSSGISAFVQTLRDFNIRHPQKPRYTNVRNEFKRIMLAFDETGSFEFYDSAERALRKLDN